MNKPHTASHYSHARAAMPRVLLVTHVIYYGATAFGLHTAHSFAAGSVMVLLVLAAALGVDHA